MSHYLDTFRSAQQKYAAYLEINRRVSPNTLRAYVRDVDNFVLWLAQERPETLKRIHPKYLAHLHREGLASGTMARKTAALKTFFKWLLRNRFFTEADLSLDLKQPKIEKRLPEYLTQEEVYRLVHAILTGKDTALNKRLKYRNAAFVLVLFTSGIRVQEAAGLKFGDIEWSTGEMRVIGKGDAERIAFISDDALSALMKWREVWGEVPGPDDTVFLNRDGAPIDTRSTRRFLKKAGQLAGIKKHIHPHIFRHSCATHLVNNGVDMRLAQELLGHVSIGSTQIYTHVSPERLKQSYLKAHPLATAGRLLPSGLTTEGISCPFSKKPVKIPASDGERNDV